MGTIKSGIKHLAERGGALHASRWLNRNRPRILMYHRVSDNPVHAGLPIATFEAQVEYIARNFNVQPVDSLLDDLSNGSSRPYSLSLTFDDGHIDFFENAWPILLKYNLPATLYITTDFLSHKCWLWPDKVKYILVSSLGKEISTPYIRPQTITQQNLQSVWSDICDHCFHQWPAGTEQCIEKIASQLGIDVPATPTGDFISVGWERINEMVAQGLNIGSHTISHPILSRISTEAQIRELKESADIIEKKTGTRPSGICYPYGMPDDFNQSTLRIAQEVGYQYGITACNTAIDLTQMFAIGRIPAAHNLQDFKWRISRPINKPA